MDIDRKLVTIRKVDKISPIEGADKIEVATVGGWNCITKKGVFKENDYGVYFEIDSFLPIEKKYEFLRKGCYKKYKEVVQDRRQEGFRIRTMKLRGVLSQGLLLPISDFPEIKDHCYSEGQDLTELLRVEKFDPPVPACLSGAIKGRFPEFLQKTDEERIQNLSEYFERYKDLTFEESEKLNGSSCSLFYNNRVFGVCSRNLELKESEDNAFWKIAKKYGIKERLEKFGKNICLQGELIGPGVQKNPYQLSENEFRVFNIWDIDNRIYLTSEQRLKYLIDISMGDFTVSPLPLAGVPILEFEYKIGKDTTINDIINMADGKSELNKDVDREGLVFKSTTLVNGKLISFKAISNKYLLKEKE